MATVSRMTGYAHRLVEKETSILIVIMGAQTPHVQLHRQQTGVSCSRNRPSEIEGRYTESRQESLRTGTSIRIAGCAGSARFPA